MYKPSSRRSSSAKGNPVSLFPFLAVLLCTMGALLGVLLIMADLAKSERQEVSSGTQDVQLQPDNANSLPAVTEELLEQIEAKKKYLRDIQAQLSSQLAQSRVYLGTIESDLNKLKAEIESLRNDAQKLDGDLAMSDTQQLKEQLAKLESELESKQKELEGLREKNRDTKPGLAVIPHKGQFNTNRYPIYVLCTSSGVILKPENICLTASDFDCNLSLGSPLESAMRAKREYLLKQKAFDPVQDGEPYPLILVRPDGISSYYAARMAISAFGNDFGYKLIDMEQALDLAYPPEDPEMTATVQQAIDRARIHKSEMAVVAPAMEGSSVGPVAYRVNASGAREAVSLNSGSRVAEVLRNSRASHSAIPSGNAGGANQFGSASATQDLMAPGFPGVVPNAIATQGAAPYGSGYNSQMNPDNNLLMMGTPGSNSQLGMQTNLSNHGGGSNGSNGQYAANGYERSGSSSVYLPMEPTAPTERAPGSNNVFGGLAEAEEIDPSSNALGNNPLLTSTGTMLPNPNVSSMGVNNGVAGSENTENMVLSLPPVPSTAHNGQTQNQAQNSNQNLLMEPEVPQWHNASAGQNDASGAKQDSAFSAGFGMKGSENGAPSVGVQASVDPAKLIHKDNDSSKHQKSLANRLGSNWAVVEHDPKAISISRPVRVGIEQNCFVVYPHNPSEKPVRLPFYGEMPDATIEGLIRTVRGQTSAWGNPGWNSYWKPYLKLTVAPGAESRVEELKAMLKDSGVEIVL